MKQKSRIHIALHVADLERSVEFYRALLGREPVKVRPRYAKFDSAEPALNLALNEVAAPAGPGRLSHLGIELESTEAVHAAAARLAAAGLAPRIEEGTECCFAVQDKAWVRDPDGNDWEVYVVTRDSDGSLAPEDGCCTPA